MDWSFSRLFSEPSVDLAFVSENARSYRFFVDAVYRETQLFFPDTAGADISFNVARNLFPGI